MSPNSSIWPLVFRSLISKGAVQINGTLSETRDKHLYKINPAHLAIYDWQVHTYCVKSPEAIPSIFNSMA